LSQVAINKVSACRWPPDSSQWRYPGGSPGHVQCPHAIAQFIAQPFAQSPTQTAGPTAPRRQREVLGN